MLLEKYHENEYFRNDNKETYQKSVMESHKLLQIINTKFSNLLLDFCKSYITKFLKGFIKVFFVYKVHKNVLLILVFLKVLK